MDPVEPASGDRSEPRRPLLMDPAGNRPSGFAPPAAGSPRSTASDGGIRTGPAHAAGPTAATGSPVQAAGATAPGGSSSVLAGGPVAAAAIGALPGEATFGPVSQVVRVSVRTASSRLDLVLPDRSTFAETLETVLEAAPRTLREQAIAHGGWVLRTAAGSAPAGSITLLDQGVVDGSTLFLTGVDAAPAVVVYDDVADAVAATVRTDPAGWPVAAGRPVALAAAGVFGVVLLLAVLWSGPPWMPVAISLAVLAAAGVAAAGWLARALSDPVAAVPVGLFAVAAGTAAATIVTAGSPPDRAVGPPQLLLGAAAAMVLAAVVGALVGSRPVPFVAVVTGSLLIVVAAGCCQLFDLPAAAGAAIVVGLALCGMPAVPRLALALAGAFPPSGSARSTAEDAAESWETDAVTDGIDPAAVRLAARRATGYLTALIQGLSWAALAGCVLLARSADATAVVLAAVVGLGLLLRSRLFPTVGQRLPLLVAGIASLTAVLLAIAWTVEPGTVLLTVALPALAGMVISLLFATGRRRFSPELARGLEILDVLTAVAVIPLVAVVLGLFEIVRGIGG